MKTTGYYGYIYLTENRVTGKKYIGQHHWEKPGIDPKYYGSGKSIKCAIKKHGKENFRVHLLERCKTKWELNARERAWILMYDAVHSPDFYNIARGGDGACPGENNPMYGVHRYGENNPMYGHQHTEESKQKMSIRHAKLTENQILEIVGLRNQGLNYTEIAQKFSVTRQTISHICNGKRCSSITGIQPENKITITHSKLTENQVMEIVELNKQGLTQKEIAEMFGVTRQTISRICNGKRYSSITGIQYKPK